MSKRKVYLTEIPLEQALEKFLDTLEQAGALSVMPGEWLPLAEADGRVTAEPVWASHSAPHYHACAMDGFALCAEETQGASEARPRRLLVGEQAFEVDTGDELPTGCDAVVAVEQVQEVREGQKHFVEILAAAAPWQNVRPLGEDIVASELVLGENHELRPADLAAAAACGHDKILVRRRPRVAVIPTGNELVPVGAEAKAGEIIEFNSLAMCAQLGRWGADCVRRPPLPDRLEILCRALDRDAGEFDMVLVNAGSSAGREDFTAAAVERTGTLVAHGLAIRPGHPVVLGLVKEKPVVGVPGYPVSALLVMELVVRPLLTRLAGRRLEPRRRMRALLTRKIYSPYGKEEFVRVSAGRVGDRLIAAALSRGAGVITSLVRADGLLRVPRDSEGFPAGAEVEIEMLRPAEDLERTIVCIGSHDPALDLLASFLSREPVNPRLATAHVGSTGGLLAIERGEAHMAGSHLLDPESGEYNLPAVRRHIHRCPVTVLAFAKRIQGLMVPRGNPKGLGSIADLARPGVRFINRQLGAGTRVLLDFELKKLGLDPGKIQGYGRQATTHLSVAVAVAGGPPDCGLGVMGAARALGLDFVELFSERYDLVVPREYLQTPLLQPLLSIIRNRDFHRAVEGMGGYDVADMGKVLAEIEP